MNFWDNPYWDAIAAITAVLALLGPLAVYLMRRRKKTAPKLVEPLVEAQTGRVTCYISSERRQGFEQLVIENVGSYPVSELRVFINDIDLTENSRFDIDLLPDKEQLRQTLRPGELLSFMFGEPEMDEPNIDRADLSWLDTDGARRGNTVELPSR